MPNMSFIKTKQQFIEGRKIKTRRLYHFSKIDPKKPVGWANLKPDKYFTAVEKSQGLRKGEHIRVLGQCICISNEPEPLDEIIRRPYRPATNFDQWFIYQDRICPHRISVHGGYYVCRHEGDNCDCLCTFKDCPGVSETACEGFPGMTAEKFVEFFCKEMKCRKTDTVCGIELRKV